MNMFNFIGENSNDLLSKMNNKDKEELLKLLKEYKIELRDNLGLKQDITFGLELEFNTNNPNNIESNNRSLNYEWLIEKRLLGAYWDFKKETSSIAGYEISSPILFDTNENWKQLSEMCNMLKNNNALITEKDAGHIHIGTQIIDNNLEDWLNFFRLYTLYENIIYRFSYGEFENKRAYISTYAIPLADKYYKNLKLIESKNDLISLRKLFEMMRPIYKKEALNFYKVSQGGTSFERNRTVEFRMPNATLEPIIWQNNVNFFTHFLESSKKDVDKDLLMKKIYEKRDNLNNYEYYNSINVNEALEICDLIFDNNLDKINFLRQYMKNFETTNEFMYSNEFINKR